MAGGSEYIIVANRLPVRRATRAGLAVWRTSPGGLVSALTPVLREVGGTWIGWSGASGSAPEPFDHEGIRNLPVPLSRAEVDGFYEGFSNGTLWPLYHDCVRAPQFRRRWWQPYVRVNERFAEAADTAAPRASHVWVHDYQLQLVPGMLRRRRPDLRIGFFLHIPFPPQELFAQLPWRHEILEGLLGADVVGFQTRTGAENFAQLARRYCGATTPTAGTLSHAGRTVHCGAFPISIEFERFAGEAADPRARERAAAVRRRLGEGRRIFLGIDRLDYTKGIDMRLKAFRQLIESGAATVDDCVLVQTAVPSRERVAAYRRERQRVEHLVGEINGELSAIGRVAVHYLHKNLEFAELVALYLAADVMLVTPLRDGMNLVSKEFVASRWDERGVLVLSEFTGAAHELRSALFVNPHDVDGMAARLARALALPQEEQRTRMRAMRQTVRRYDVFHWARSFRHVLEGGSPRRLAWTTA